jgi:hypothetical protein
LAFLYLTRSLESEATLTAVPRMLLITDPELKSPFDVNVKYWKLEDQPRWKESGYGRFLAV